MKLLFLLAVFLEKPHNGFHAFFTFKMNTALQKKLDELPDKPGCYLFRDRRGTIIYIGKALSLRKRVRSYFRDSTLRAAPPKLRSLINSVVDLDILALSSEARALLAEAQLVKQYRPRYNVLLRDDKAFLSIRGDAAAALPKLAIARAQREDGALYFGPFPSAAVVRAALDFTQKNFKLRVCKPSLPDVADHAHCHDQVLRFCSAPCTGVVSREEYRKLFDEACAFLSGRRPAVLGQLKADMEAAAAALDFEGAATLRDTLHALTQIIRNRKNVLPSTAPAKAQAESAAEALAQLQALLKLEALPVHIECFDNSNLFGTHAVSSMVRATNGVPDARHYRHFRVRTESAADDPAVMREVVTRRYSRLVAEGLPLPGLVVLDGGSLQLRAAREALGALGLSVPTIGLAERHEEVVVEPFKPPLLLEKDSPPLLLLMRLRDEAHRFAVGYHRKLRSKLLRESVLDEVDGVGPAKKEALVRRFGSVKRIAAATREELAAVPGIGEKLAGEILARLTVK